MVSKELKQYFKTERGVEFFAYGAVKSLGLNQAITSLLESISKLENVRLKYVLSQSEYEPLLIIIEASKREYPTIKDFEEEYTNTVDVDSVLEKEENIEKDVFCEYVIDERSVIVKVNLIPELEWPHLLTLS